MENETPPEITPDAVEKAALDARVTLSAVLDRSGVSRGAFYAWKRGESVMLPLTRLRLMDAAAELSRERAA